MTFSSTYRAGPAIRIGDRSFFVVSRQTAARWESGCTGALSPVALVVLEDGMVSVYGLDPAISEREVSRIVRDAFSQVPDSQFSLPEDYHT
ncbi:MAG: hypothetical protein QMC82_08370 [Methanolinea sp.]|nr:hypothetical protein [Methanolinea sp.]